MGNGVGVSMFETGIMLGAIVWLLSGLWFVVSIMRLFRKRWRKSALLHLKLAAGLFVLSLAAVIWCNQFVYLDYGLASREELEQARAERKTAAQAERAAAAARAEAEKAAAAKLKAEREAEQAVLDARKKAEQQAAEAARKAEKEAAELARKCGDTTMAFVMSQEFVTRNLKAPSTAKFPWYTDNQVSVTQKPGCAFRVVAWVDAQNGFGAQIRSRYVVDLKYLAASGEWLLTDIEIR